MFLACTHLGALMAMTDNQKPYRRGSGGHKEAAADIVIMLGLGDKKKQSKPKSKKK
jgi:hypothetical protein